MLGNKDAIDSMLKDYVQKQYNARYQVLLKERTQQETEVLMVKLIQKLVESKTIEEFGGATAQTQ